MLVDEPRAAAAQRLGQQRHRVGARVERRRVELDELDVGERRAGAPGEREAVAGGLDRIRRPREDLADAAGRQHDRAGAVQHDGPSGVAREDAGHAAAVHHELERQGALEDAQAAAVAQPLAERADDLGAGGIAGVQDARARVRGLAREVEPAGGVAVEPRAERQELRQAIGAVGVSRAHRGRVAEPSGDGQGVGGVQRRRVARRHRARDAALRPGARAGLPEQALREEVDAAGAEAERHGEAGDARAEDDDVGLADASRSRGASVGPLRGRPPASARRRGARARRRRARSRRACSSVCSERRIFGSVMRFMCGHRLHGRTNSTSGELHGDVVAHRALGDQHHLRWASPCRGGRSCRRSSRRSRRRRARPAGTPGARGPTRPGCCSRGSGRSRRR